MTRTEERLRLGMDRSITRRDFINGVAVAIGAASASWTFAEEGEVYYPPALTGLRGSHAGSFEAAHRLRDGGFPRLPDVDLSEEYDLVVAGGGLSGLAAALFFKKAFGEDKTVLILDNHDDFGGHAKRNEFRHQGEFRIGYGGTMLISTPFPYSYSARALVEELGIEVDRYREHVDWKVYDGLGAGMFFDRETFGADLLARGFGDVPWPEFFEKTCLSETAKRDLTRLYTEKKDYLPGLSSDEKRARLARMSYQDFLLNVANVTPEAIPFFRSQVFRNAMHIDTAPALHVARHHLPGFEGMALDLEDGFDESSYQFHYPDGNATLARLLVKRLIPEAFEGGETPESMVLAKADYGKLDVAGRDVRIRLNSTVIRVEHEGPPEAARSLRVAYVRREGSHGVRARHVILACYNSMIPYIAPELPESQKEALRYAAKVPLMYTNVFLRNWKAWKKLGISSFHAPGMYHSSGMLDFPVSIGGYACPRNPEEPIVAHLVHYPTSPGLPRREQNRAGRRELLATSFEKIELETRRELERLLAGGGFDPKDDILAITANRWPHGYSYTPDSLGDPDLPFEEQPHVVGRKPLGRMAIANSDSEAAAFTNTAFDAAHRAVQELLRARGMI
jgi:spermidine dehydrogenase